MSIKNKKVLEKFTIKNIKNFEGCPDAAKVLYARYKDETDNLLKRKKDFVHLIVEDNKPEWAINFLLNILDEHHKFSFFEKRFNDAVYCSGDKDFSYNCLKAFKAIKKNEIEKVDAAHNELFKVVVPYLTNPSNPKQMITISLYRIINLLKEDNKREFTRSLTYSFQKISEIETFSSHVSYEDNLKGIAIDLVESIKDWIEV